MSIIIPISAFRSNGRRYFRTCPGHGHTPRAILFRDIMLDSSSFLPADILVAIASNPLRQSVSAIRTPRGLLSFLSSIFHLPLSILSSIFVSFFFYPLFTLLHPISSPVYSSLYALPPSLSISPPGVFAPLPLPLRFISLPPPPAPPLPELNPMLFSFRLFVLFVSSICPVSLFAFRVCLSFHACTSPLSLSLSLCLVRLFFNNLPRATMERPIYFQTQNFQLDSRRRSENSRVRRVGNVMQINDKSDRTRGCK